MPSYHLWLKPSGEAYEVLAATIRELSRRLQAPVFEPHVTVLGRLIGRESDLIAQTHKFARQLRPFPIILTRPSYRDAYFQCLFLLVEQTGPVIEANTRARCAFNHDGGADYMPHVSLVYGLYSTDVKERVIAGLGSHLEMTFEAAILSLVRSHSDDPQDWHEIAVAPMGIIEGVN
jgi:2'-5' RNA ligase